MTEFNYNEISAEMARLDYPSYPSTETFTEDEIAEAVRNLAKHYLTVDTATLTGDTFSPATMEAFAKLARTLRTDVVKDYSGFKLVRETTDEERREAAISSLKSHLHEVHRASAKRSLQRKMDAVDSSEYPEVEAIRARLYSEAS